MIRHMFLVLPALMICGVANAGLSKFKLFSPQTPENIQISDNGKQITVSISLPCSNETALDWSVPAISSDDSGDQIAYVGVVVPLSKCQAGPLTKHTKTFDPTLYGYSTKDVDFLPMRLEK